MILMDVKLNNIYGFTDFHMNFSYPKKIVNSIIDSEWLSGHPNFRYKKAVILTPAEKRLQQRGLLTRRRRRLRLSALTASRRTDCLRCRRSCRQTGSLPGTRRSPYV